MTALVLAAPQLGKPFVIETDASGTAIAAILLQYNEQEELHPIAYESRVLNKHEKNYPVIELEALGIVFAIHKFAPYITGAETSVIITDHEPLTSLLRRRDLSGRLAKYQIAIREYNIRIIYRAGKKNYLADSLFRHPPAEKITAIEITDLPTLEQIKEEQRNCSWIKGILNHITTGYPADKITTRRSRRYIISHDILHQKKPYSEDVIVLDEKAQLKNIILKYFHKNAFAGAHLGIERTHEKLGTRFSWTDMNKDISDFIRACQEC